MHARTPAPVSTGFDLLACECFTRTQPESLISMFSASVKAPPAGQKMCA